MKTAPIYGKKQNILLPNLVNGFGISKKDFSKISGVSESLLSRSSTLSPKVRGQVIELVSIYMILWAATKGNENAIREQLHKPEDQYWGLSPIQFMKTERDNVQVVLRNLHAITFGEAMGC